MRLAASLLLTVVATASQVAAGDARGQAPRCHTIDFEGLAEARPPGAITGPATVFFGGSYLVLIDDDAGGLGSIANEPSGNTVVDVFSSTPNPIELSRGVSSITLSYSAARRSLPATLTAWSGPGASGQVLATEVANEVGSRFDGARCSGDPNGSFCRWATVSLSTAEARIRSLSITGVQSDFFLFDDFTYCLPAGPVVVNVGSERTLAPASVRPSGARVVGDRRGRRAFLWQQMAPSGAVLRAQLFDRFGTAAAPAQTLSTEHGLHSEPSAALRDGGELVVAWRFDQTRGPAGRNVLETRILARSLGGSGSASTDHRVIARAAADQLGMPSISTDRTGRTLLAWSSHGQLRAGLLDLDGHRPTNVVAITDSATPARSLVSATSAAGQRVLVWRADGARPGLRARVWQPGHPPGDTFEIVQSPDATRPSVAADDLGGFVVVWQQGVGAGTDIHGRRYSAAAVGGPIFTVNQATAGSQGRPRVDMNSGGEFAVVWQSSGGSTLPGGQVLARLFDGAANAETDDLVIAIDNGGEPVSPDISFDDRDNIAVAYERRDSAARSTGVFRRSVVTSRQPAGCVADATTLCLNDSRFEVRARWRNAHGQQGQARASALTADTGSFWFFDRGNVEVVVKALDACAIADSFWIFAAGLTDVEVSLQVEDTKSGESISYFSPFSPFQPIRDTSAFGGCPTASDEPGGAQPWSAEPQPARGNRLQTGRSTAKAAAPCSPTTTTLCLGGRFELSMLFETRAGQSGAGQAVAMTADTGYFWFFSEDNVEAVVKVLDGCDLNDRFWVFAGGLTDVKVDLMVHDLLTGQSRVYSTPGGSSFPPIQDLSAFDACQP